MKLLNYILCYCWIGFHVVMYNLKVCYGCYLKFYSTFYENYNFYKHVGGGTRMGVNLHPRSVSKAGAR